MFVKRILFSVLSIMVVLGGMFAFAKPAKAISNTVSTTFPNATGGSGVYAIVHAPDGSTYVGGRFTMIGSTPRNNIARILADGVTVDPAFNPDVTTTTFNATVTSLALDSNTNTLYFGGFNFDTVNGSVTRNNLAAVNATTGVVTSFDADITGSVSTLVLDMTANILYMGGSIISVNGGTPRSNLAAVNSSSGLTTAFNPTTDGNVSSLVLTSSGATLYAGGSFSLVNGATTRNNVAAFNTATSVETTFDPDIGGRVGALALSSTGSTLYVGGQYATVNGATTRNNLAAFDTTTSTATAFDPDITSGSLGIPVGALVITPGGNTILVSGGLGAVNGGTVRTGVAELDLTTSLATSFDPVPSLSPDGSGGGVYALAINSAGTGVYVGGEFFVNPATETNLACVGSCITAPPVPPTPTPTTPTSNSGTLAPTGEDTRLPIGIAITSFVLGTVGVGWLVLKKKHSSI